MSGTQQALLAAGAPGPDIVGAFARWQVVAQAAAGATSTATLSIRADGTATGSGSPTDETIPGSSKWYSGGTPTPYWIKATNTGAALTGGDAVGSWLSLASGRTWTMAKTTTISTATLKLEWATDSAGTNIVLTSTSNTITSDHSV